MATTGDITADFLRIELERAQKSLTATHDFIQKLHEQEETKSSAHDDENIIKPSTAEQLVSLQHKTSRLLLAKDIAIWMKSVPANDTVHQLFVQAELCCSLAELLVRHEDILELDAHLFSVKYLSLYEYVHRALIISSRKELLSIGYPSAKACKHLLRDCKKEGQFWTLCRFSARLQSGHALVLDHVEGGSPFRQSEIVTELIRPLVTKVHFHFVEESQDRVTTQRIERLPEWLLMYVKDNFLEGGPWKLVTSGLTSIDNAIPASFLNEIIRMVRWVLNQRKYFQHEQIAGPKSNPIFLVNAIEQIFQFDQYLSEKLAKARIDLSAVPSLTDALVRQNEEVYDWWIDREKESVFSTLFDDTPVVKPLANRVAPRAEVFCALVRSIQKKAGLLSAPGLYMTKVAVPLCNQFLDLIQDTSSELRNLLCYQQRGVPSESHLVANLNEWIELVNGAHLACLVLSKDGSWQDGTSISSQSDHDLARFGQSLKRLQTVLVEEFASSFVEIILMEKAKLASYLMLAAHMLASQEWESDDTDLSAELRESSAILACFHRVCMASDAVIDNSEVDVDADIAHFAPIAMYEEVMNRLSEKLLAVALDLDNVTPDIWLQGASVFSRDVAMLIHGCKLPLALRLLDACTLLSANAEWVAGIKEALEGLIHTSDYLNLDEFESDSNLYEEASSMVKAKGLAWIELGDVLSILNRRRDLPSFQYHA